MHGLHESHDYVFISPSIAQRWWTQMQSDVSDVLACIVKSDEGAAVIALVS